MSSLKREIKGQLVDSLRSIDEDFRWDDGADLTDMLDPDTWTAVVWPAILRLLEFEVEDFVADRLNLPNWEGLSFGDLLETLTVFIETS